MSIVPANNFLNNVLNMIKGKIFFVIIIIIFSIQNFLSAKGLSKAGNQQLKFLSRTSFQNDEIRFTHITSEDGLSLNGVTKIFQDSKGFMWFGTYNGLNRYDGYNFKIFLPDPGNPRSISNHSIYSIIEDKYGYIWIATLDGLNRYDRKTEEFYTYKHNPNDPNSISSNNILSILEDKSGTIWVGTLDGLNKYNREKDNFTVIKKVSDRLNPDSLNSVVCIEEDFNGNLWLGTWNGLTCMSKDGKVIKQFFAQPANYKNFDYRIISYLFEDNSKTLWIGFSNKGLAKYDYKTNKMKFYKSVPNNPNTISDDHINVIYQDNLNNLWIGTKNGLNKYEALKDKFIRILNDPKKSYSIIDNNILSILEDKTGLIWIGTGGGISKFYIPKNKFYYLDENAPISKRIGSIFIDRQENIWLGSFDGVDKIVKSENRVIHYRHLPGNKNSLSDNYVMSVYEDNTGTIWIGTHHSGLNRFNPQTGEFKLYTYDINDNTSISNNGITSICQDHNGNLWFGTWWGLNRFDRKTEKFYRYLNDKSNPNSLPYDLIWVVMEDSEGMIWIGTDGGGASMFNPKTNTFTNFSRDSSSAYIISENRVLAIFESSDGIIWLGTTDGLSCFDRKKNKVKIYKTKDGLPSNLINGIIEDNKGYLWISSDKGLTKFDRKTESFYNFTKRQGLKEIEFNQNTVAKSKDGMLYFACKNGLMFFNPDSIKNEYFSAPVVFTDLKIFNESVPISKNDHSILKESITEVKSVSIPHGYDVITIDFALLDFFNVKKNRYLYKLVGFDVDWNNVGSRNSATYTNLPPGEYNFIVKAYNDDGILNTKEASLRIIILPAFYQTSWFKIILIASLILLIGLYVNIRTRKIKKLNRILEKRVLERTKDLDFIVKELSQEIIERKKAEEKVKASLQEKEILLKEIHHRVKNNLQVISSLLYLQSLNLKDEVAINSFKDSQDRIRCMALIHEKLYRSKDLGSINFSDYLKSLIEDLSKSFMNENTNVKTIINADEINLSLDTALSCGLIVNELVTNAFKYAFPSSLLEKQNDFKIEVGIKKNDFKYLLTISDNGIGLPNDIDLENTESLGLKLVYTIVNQLNGSIEINSERGTHYKIIFEDI